MKTELIPELFNTPTKTFEEHLNLPYNERILFSGIYGIGKSTFLRHFFNLEENKEKYNVIHLYPVNYSVLENEDVFTYIKYDILYELIAVHKVEFRSEHFTFLEALPFFLQGHGYQVFSAFLLTIPKLGKQLFQFSQELEKLHSQFKQLQEGGEQDEAKVVDDFLQAFHQGSGLYESNMVTQLIVQALQGLSDQGTEGKKKNILIIDDLDRIDPNHIFRLFNIFAAHFDHRDKGELVNKFGFDQVIFVCDLDNIRGIFRNNYGTSVDFNGYIDKFFSLKVYEYLNHQALLNIVTRVMSDGIQRGEFPTFKDKKYGHFYTDSFRVLEYFLDKFISSKRLNLRVYLKFLGDYKPRIKSRPVLYGQGSFRIYTTQAQFLFVSDLLFEIFGDYNYLLDSMIYCKENLKLVEFQDIYYEMIPQILFLLDYERHQFKLHSKTQSNELGYQLDNNLVIHYTMKMHFREYYAILNEEHTSKQACQHVNIFSVYIDLLKLLNSIGYFNYGFDSASS